MKHIDLWLFQCHFHNVCANDGNRVATDDSVFSSIHIFHIVVQFDDLFFSLPPLLPPLKFCGL